MGGGGGGGGEMVVLIFIQLKIVIAVSSCHMLHPASARLRSCRFLSKRANEYRKNVRGRGMEHPSCPPHFFSLISLPLSLARSLVCSTRLERFLVVILQANIELYYSTSSRDVHLWSGRSCYTLSVHNRYPVL